MGDRRYCELFRDGVDDEGNFCRMDCNCGADRVTQTDGQRFERWWNGSPAIRTRDAHSVAWSAYQKGLRDAMATNRHVKSESAQSQMQGFEDGFKAGYRTKRPDYPPGTPIVKVVQRDLEQLIKHRAEEYCQEMKLRRM